MANFVPRKINLSQINGGQRYELGDVLSSPDPINAPIEAAALLQNLATNAPDVSEANKVGTPTVEIGGTESNPKFVFKNLKGDKGEKGEVGPRGASGTSAVLENENHDSDEDGYTQHFVNSNFSNPNILINGDFQVWQRGTSLSQTNGRYCSDRWRVEIGSEANATTTKTEEGLHFVANSITPTYLGISQRLETNNFLKKQILTFSALVKSNYECYGLIRYRNSEGTNTTLVRTNVHTGNGDWQLLTCTYDISRINEGDITEIAVKIQSYSVTDFSANILFAKLEVGYVATPLTPRPYAEELAMCQRYYQLRSNSYEFSESHLDRCPVMRSSGTVGTISIEEVSYKYADAELY